MLLIVGSSSKFGSSHGIHPPTSRCLSIKIICASSSFRESLGENIKILQKLKVSYKWEARFLIYQGFRGNYHSYQKNWNNKLCLEEGEVHLLAFDPLVSS